MASSRQVAQTWLLRLARDTRLEEQLKSQRFRHPETGNQVLFQSLPIPEQAKIRQRYQQPAQPEPPGEPRQKGPWTERVLEKAKAAVDATTQAGKNLVRFIKEPEYREEVKAAFVAKKDDTKAKLAVEARESKEMLKTVRKVFSGHEKVSEQEKKAAVDQLKDIGRLAVLTSVTVMPLGPLDDILLLALTAGVRIAFPEFSWMPSAWRTPVEAADGKDLADRISDRLVEGILKFLENPTEEMVMEALEEMGRSRG